eukprot:369399_1
MGCCLSSAKPDEDLELDKDLMALEEANGGTGDPPENFVDNGKFGFANLMDGVRSGFSKVKNFDRIKSGADKFFDKDRTYNQRMPLVVALLLCITLTLLLVYGGAQAGHRFSAWKNEEARVQREAAALARSNQQAAEQRLQDSGSSVVDPKYLRDLEIPDSDDDMYDSEKSSSAALPHGFFGVPSSSDESSDSKDSDDEMSSSDDNLLSMD